MSGATGQSGPVPRFSVVAALQQAAGVWCLALGVGLAAWGWTSDTVSAAWGLLPLGTVAAVVWVQFVLAYAVNAVQGVAAWSTGGLLRAIAGEFRSATAVFAWRQPWAWRHQPPLAMANEPPRGVLLVHGYLCNRGLWQHWHQVLAQRGHPVEAVNLEPVWGSIDDYVPTLEAAVARLTAQTGQPPLVVAHSMGGLAVRAWLRSGAGNGERVAHVFTIGTPHQGTWLARWGLGTNVHQMRLASPWLCELAAAEPPQRARLFTCWHSGGDNIVFPLGTAVLPGSAARELPHVGHVALVDDPRVLADVLRWLDSHVPV